MGIWGSEPKYMNGFGACICPPVHPQGELGPHVPSSKLACVTEAPSEHKEKSMAEACFPTVNKSSFFVW